MEARPQWPSAVPFRPSGPTFGQPPSKRGRLPGLSPSCPWAPSLMSPFLLQVRVCRDVGVTDHCWGGSRPWSTQQGAGLPPVQGGHLIDGLGAADESDCKRRSALERGAGAGHCSHRLHQDVPCKQHTGGESRGEADGTRGEATRLKLRTPANRRRAGGRLRAAHLPPCGSHNGHPQQEWGPQPPRLQPPAPRCPRPMPHASQASSSSHLRHPTHSTPSVTTLLFLHNLLNHSTQQPCTFSKLLALIFKTGPGNA